MATLALGAVGTAAFQGFASNVIGSLVGFAVSRLFAGKPEVEKPQLPDLSVQSATLGAPIPEGWGTIRLAGNLVFALDIEVQEEEIEAGKGGGATGILYHYFGTFSPAFCFGPQDGTGANGIRRIWADSKLLYDQSETTTPQNIAAVVPLADALTFHLGTNDQLPSALQEQHEGAGNVPAYRRIVYVDIERLNLDEFGARLPSISAEVSITGAPSYTVDPPWEDRPPIDENRNIRYQDGVHHFGETGGGNPRTSITMKHQSWTILGEKIGEKDYTFTGASGALFVTGYVENTGALVQDLFYAYGAQTGVWGFWEGTAFLGQATDTGGGVVPSLDKLVWSKLHGAVYGLRFGTGMVYRFDATEVSDTGQLAITLQASAQLDVTATLAAAQLEHVWPDINDAGRVWVAIDTAGVGNDEVWLLDKDLTGVTTRFDLGSQSVGDKAGVIYDPQSGRFVIGGGAGDGFFVYDVDLAGGTVTLRGSGTTDRGPSGKAHAYPPIAIGTAALLVWAQYVTPGLIDQGTVPVADIIKDISALAGLDAADVNTTAVTDQVTGFMLPRPMTAKSALGPILEAFPIDAFESDHQLKFATRTDSAPIAVLTLDDLGAAEPGAGEGDASPPDRLVLERREPTELIRQLVLRHRDPEARHEAGAQTYRRIVGVSTNDRVIDIPASMTVTAAARAAERIVLDDSVQRHAVSFSTSIKLVRLDPSDRLTIDGRTGRVVSVEHDWTTLVTSGRMVIDEPATLTGTITGDPAPPDDESVQFSGTTVLALLDIPLLRDLDDAIGFYFSMGGVYPDWPGAALFQSRDGTNWLNLTSVTARTPIGSATTALADGPASFDWEKTDWTGIANQPWDAVNTVDILLATDDTLGNASQSEVLAGSNSAVLAGELIGWTTATSIGPRAWRLSNLLRGRRGSQEFRASHAIGDAFTVVSLTLTRNLFQGQDDLNASLIYRGVAFGTALTDAPRQSFTNTGRRLVPFSVVGSNATRPPVNTGWDVTIEWFRRSRLGDEYRNFASDPPPLDAPLERYAVEIWDTGQTAIKRTFDVIGTPSVVYTEAQQNTDWGQAGAAFHLRIYQVHDHPQGTTFDGPYVFIDWAGFADGGPRDPATEPSTTTPAVNSAPFIASQEIPAGRFVNIHNPAGSGPRVRLAQSGGTPLRAHGFVNETIPNGATGTVYFSGVNRALTGLSVGANYYLATIGQTITTRPTAAGFIAQRVGTAMSTTELVVNLGADIVRK